MKTTADLFYESPDVTLFHGDAFSVVRGLENESIDCVVTHRRIGASVTTPVTRISGGRRKASACTSIISFIFSRRSCRS